MLRRFADARLRAALDRETNKREHAQDLARRLGSRLKQAQADLADAKDVVREEAYRDVLEGRAILARAELERQERQQLAAERARTQETQP